MFTTVRKRVLLTTLVVIVAAVTAVSLVHEPNNAGAAQRPATNGAFQRAADSQGTRANVAQPFFLPAAAAAAFAARAAFAGARALAGNAAFRGAVVREATNVARAAGIGSVAKDVAGALFGLSAPSSASGSDVLLDGAAAQ